MPENSNVITAKENGSEKRNDVLRDEAVIREINNSNNTQNYDTKISIDELQLEHSTKGTFTYDNRTGAVSRMKGGGHGRQILIF